MEPKGTEYREWWGDPRIGRRHPRWAEGPTGEATHSLGHPFILYNHNQWSKFKMTPSHSTIMDHFGPTEPLTHLLVSLGSVICYYTQSKPKLSGFEQQFIMISCGRELTRFRGAVVSLEFSQAIAIRWQVDWSHLNSSLGCPTNMA
jgi:hypothetical protein